MANTKHKRRGSTLSLVIMLLLLVALAVAIIFFPVEAKATTSLQQPDDLAKTTLVHAGDTAPDFTVQMLDGSRVTLSSLRGKPLLLIFWATWCPPCRNELAHLQEGVIDVYGDKISVLPISRGEDEGKVKAFIKKMGYSFNVGLDPDQYIYRLYATNYIPRCCVIDDAGVVVYAGVGYDDVVAAEVRAALDKALAK